MESFIFFACLIIVCMAFYLLGRSDGARDAVPPLSDEAQLELEKYKYDAFYAHERWKEEKYSAPIMAYEEALDEGADWRGDHEE